MADRWKWRLACFGWGVAVAGTLGSYFLLCGNVWAASVTAAASALVPWRWSRQWPLTARLYFRWQLRHGGLFTVARLPNGIRLIGYRSVFWIRDREYTEARWRSKRT